MLEAEPQSKEEQSKGPRTHMGHTDASAEGDLALGLDSMKLGQDAASVRGECGQYFAVTGIWRKQFHDFRLKQVSLNYV